MASMKFEGEKLFIDIEEYENGNMALILYCDDGEPFADLTINTLVMPVKEWACIDVNNFPEATDLIKKYDLATFTGKTISGGFCTYPVFEFNMDNVNKYKLKEVE